MYSSRLSGYSNVDRRFSPNISIEKHIERHQLLLCLSLWLKLEREGELRRKATYAMMAFYDNESSPVFANQPKELDLSECNLKSIPNIFCWPPFTGLVKIDLSGNRLEKLPFMNQLQNLHHINLKGNYFEYIPDTLFDCENIEYLELSDNKLLEISPRIKELKKLTTLNLNSNQLDLLPPEMNELRSLEILYLDDNHLEKLPDLSMLQKCRDICISRNEFSTFPATLSTLPNLEIVNCSHNRLSELPSSVQNLQKIYQLDLSNNEFKEFPPCIPHLTNLEELLIDNNQLKDLSNLHLLENLTVLSVGSNALNKLPPDMILPPLSLLFMSRNDLKTIPPFITNCSSITKLALDNNAFESLPDSIGNLTNLYHLSLNNNELHSLPSSFSTLEDLRELELEGNKFTEFPKEILELSNIEKINLDGNELSEIPSSILELEHLEEFNISENRLTNLPDSFEKLPRSLVISVDGNLFSAEEVQRIQNIVNSRNYSGPIIEGLGIQEDQEENLPGESITEICKLLFEFSQQTPREFVNLPSDSLVLLSWLQRLGSVAEFKTETNKKVLATKVLDILGTANENPLFRETFFKVIDEASATCGDRVALSIINLDIKQQLETINLMQIQETASFLLRSMFPMDLLEKHALKKIREKQATDNLETFLAYPIKLKEDLNLPFTQGEMRYFECSQVTPGDLQEAKDMVLSHQQNQEKCISFLIDNDVWKKVLSLNYPKEWQRIENNKNLAMEADDPDSSGILKKFKEELKILTEKVLYHPEAIENQSLEDPLDMLMNCLEKSKFNPQLVAKYLVEERENLLRKIFSNSETKEQILYKYECLLATLYFLYQQNSLKNIELFSFLLPTSASTNSVSSMSCCVKEILSRNSGRLYVEILHKLFEQQEIREELFKSFSLKEKNPLNPYAKNVNFLTRLTQLTNATLQSFRQQPANADTRATLCLFSLLKNIKELSENQNEPTSIKRMRRDREKDIDLLLSRFEEIRKIMESSSPLLDSDDQEIVLHCEDIMGLISNYKKYQNTLLDKSDGSVKEKDLATTFDSLNEKFKNLCAQKAEEAQKYSIHTMSLIAGTWLAGASGAVPRPNVTIPLAPRDLPSSSATFSPVGTSSAIPSTSNASNVHRNHASTDVTEAALSCLPPAPDTPLRSSERRERARDATTRIAMMDPIYYKKV